MRVERREELTQWSVKSVHIWNFSDLYFPAFGLNTEYLSLFSPNAGKYGPEKLRKRALFIQCPSKLYDKV